ncbi:MAG: helix-turn-helix transcriptional regulator [Deltaproteobacteria bacterium]|nr:helix-turn-helix transcriptional regulator [Deltaproteobacteria bacterium]
MWPSTKCVEAIEAAGAPLELGQALIEESAQEFGITNANFIPASCFPVLTVDDVVIWAEDLDWSDRIEMWNRFVELNRFQSQEVCPIDAVFGRCTRVLDVYEIVDEMEARRTTIYNEFWRPYQIERQLVLALGDRGDPLALSGLCRSIKERPFDSEERRRALELARLVEKALRSMRAMGPVHHALAEVVHTLDKGLPLAAILFNRTGRLCWLSQEARIRFHVPSTRLSANLLVPRLNHALKRVRKAAMDALNRPVNAFYSTMDLSDVLRPGESLLLRCWRNSESDFVGVLAVIESAQVLAVGERPLVMPSCLTAKEREVAMLAAKGETEREIAEHLGIAHGTVHTHLKHIYSKLQVYSRAELVQRLLPRD